MGLAHSLKFVLAIMLILLNALGFALGTVLMSIAAWQWVSYAANPPLYDSIFGADSREVLIFFISSGAALLVLSIVGILAGVCALLPRLKHLAVALLLLYTAIVFALYTFEVISVTLDFSQFFAGKDTIATTVGGAFSQLVAGDGYWNSTNAEFFNNWQTKYQCCGWNNGSDYAWGAYAMANNNSEWRPSSCCGWLNTTVGEMCTPSTETYYWPGCKASFLTAYSNLEWSVIGISIAASVVEGLVLVFSLLLVGLVMSSKPCPEKE